MYIPKYYLKIKNCSGTYKVPEVKTDHELANFMLSKLITARGFEDSPQGCVEFINTVLTNDNNKGLYPNKSEGIKDIAEYIMNTFIVIKHIDDEPIGKRKSGHVKFIIKKTMETNLKLLDDRSRKNVSRK